jgi:hypothetical protein
MTADFRPDHRGVGEMLRSPMMVAVVTKVGIGIIARAEAIAPVGPMTDPHRGRYRASFGMRVSRRGGATRDRAECVVYNDSPEASYVEWGHFGQEPYHTLAQAAFGVRL